MKPKATFRCAVLLGIALAAGCAGGSDGDERADAAGDPNVVRLDSAALAAASIALDSVRTIQTTSLETTGVLGFDANAVASVGPKAEGRIVRVLVDLGTRVDERTPLAELESQEVGDLKAELARALAEAALARQDYEREQQLYDQRVSSERDMLEARAAYQSALADSAAAVAKLRLLGGDEGEGTAFTVSSPIAGTVVERNATLGQIAEADAQLFTVADLRRLWLIVDVYERDLAKVAEGQRVDIRTVAFTDAVFSGEVGYVGQVVDAESHTVKVRVVVDNPGRLRPGMFAQAEIFLPVPGATLAVPRAAVQELRGSQVVFVPEADGGFRAIPIGQGDQVGDSLVIVTSGLAPGQRVVGSGSFFLKSELLKATFGDID